MEPAAIENTVYVSCSDTDESVLMLTASMLSSSITFKFSRSYSYRWFRTEVLNRYMRPASKATLKAIVEDDQYLINYSIVRNYELLPVELICIGCYVHESSVCIELEYLRRSLAI